VLKQKTGKAGAFRCGIWLGANLCLSAYALYTYVQDYLREVVHEPMYSYATFYLFRLLLFPILMAMLIALNVRIWNWFQINYVFIFEFDPRNHLNVWQFLEVVLN
jgi:hypothetical protein